MWQILPRGIDPCSSTLLWLKRHSSNRYLYRLPPARKILIFPWKTNKQTSPNLLLPWRSPSTSTCPSRTPVYTFRMFYFVLNSMVGITPQYLQPSHQQQALRVCPRGSRARAGAGGREERSQRAHQSGTGASCERGKQLAEVGRLLARLCCSPRKHC